MRKRRSTQAIRGLVVPPSIIVRLGYSEWAQATLDPGGTGAPATHYYRANDVFDPDFTSTGHQPRGFDQWMGFYNHFSVIGSRIEVVFTGTGTTAATSAAAVGVALTATTVGFATNYDVLEYPTQVKGNLTLHRDMAKLSKTFSMKKFFGLKGGETGSIYKGNASFSPTEQAFYCIYANSLSANDVGPVIIRVRIQYIVKMTERKQLAQS